LLDEWRVAHGGRPYDDAGDALLQPRFHGRGVTHAATELHRDADGFQNTIDGRRIDRLAGKGPIEIDDVQIFKALLLKGARLRGRVAMKHGRALHVALLEPHRETFLEIDGREEDHGDHFKKFAINASPRRWLFSGWNCVPTMLSRPTIAVSGPP